MEIIDESDQVLDDSTKYSIIKATSEGDAYKIYQNYKVGETILLCGAKNIPYKADGHYEWYQNAWLLIHETLRREFRRGEYAITKMNVIKHPWHIINVHTWLSDYLLRVVHVHHDGEEQVVGPYYAKLGSILEFGHNKTHQELLKLMTDVEKKSKI